MGARTAAKGAPLDYAIPTQRVVVDLVLSSRSPRRGELFLDAGRSVERALAALLEEHGPFFPFLDVNERAISLIHRGDVVRLSVIMAAVGDEAPESWQHRRPVRLELDGGPALHGEVVWSAPAPRSRLSDHLNEPTRFLLLSQDAGLSFVHKAHVVRVVEAEGEGARPEAR